MEYLTVLETARKWDLSPRMVQHHCTAGHIPGAQKFGKSWAIPADAEKPQGAQSAPKLEETAGVLERAALMPLMNTPFQPGTCVAAVRAMEAGPRRDIAWAEYYYFTSQPEKAARAAGAFIAATSAVLLHLPLPRSLPSAKEFLPLLPPGLRAFALYVQAHHLYLKKNYTQSIGVAEATLSMGAASYPIPAIYLHLIAVMDYMRLKKTDLAQDHLLAAWEIARPDDLIEGFGEHHGLMGAMLEAVIKPRWPEDFKRIIDITNHFSKGWRDIHNPDTGQQVADNLTTTEFVVAMLMVQDWTCEEIASHMGVSASTVRRHQAQIKKKLQVKNRHELMEYMLP